MPSGHYLEPYGSKWSFSGCIRHFRVGRAQQHHISSQPFSKNWFKEYVPKQTSQGTTLIRLAFKPEYIPCSSTSLELVDVKLHVS